MIHDPVLSESGFDRLSLTVPVGPVTDPGPGGSEAAAPALAAAAARRGVGAARGLRPQRGLLKLLLLDSLSQCSESLAAWTRRSPAQTSLT